MANDPKDVIAASESLPDGLVLRVRGEIDFNHSPALRRRLLDVLASKPPRLILDLGLVPYMDSSGVASLIEVLQGQRRGGRLLVLCNLQPRVQGIFEIARLDSVFKIVADVAAAKTA